MARMNRKVKLSIMVFLMTLVFTADMQMKTVFTMQRELAARGIDARETNFQRRANLNRDRAGGHERLVHDYFSQDPIFHADIFRRRFRMHQRLFRRIERACVAHNSYFIQKRDATGLLGLSSLQKVTAAIRLLAYGASADQLDEYLRLGESTSLQCLNEFCKSVMAIFGPEYLRKPTVEETAQILKHSAARGFPGMLGSVDCMHWEWHMCPIGWQGQFQDRSGARSIILEAVATHNLRIWHSYFGEPGSLNDLNVLDRSHLFYDVQNGVSPTTSFIVNGRTFHQPYYLADGIYPKWPVFVQTISQPTTEKRKYFAKRQEGARKDIERAFGVLRARWWILENPSRLWQRSALNLIMTTCLILHNMIVEDEQGSVECLEWPDVPVYSRTRPHNEEDWRTRFAEIISTRREMRNRVAYDSLQESLVEHLWTTRKVWN